MPAILRIGFIYWTRPARSALSDVPQTSSTTGRDDDRDTTAPCGRDFAVADRSRSRKCSSFDPGAGLGTLAGKLRGIRPRAEDGAVTLQLSRMRAAQATNEIGPPRLGGAEAIGMPEGAGVIPSEAVLVVEDDPLVRHALTALFRSAGLDVITFPSGATLLAETLPDTVSCLVVDVRLPMGSGLELHNELKARGIAIPVIFMTGFGDVPMSVGAMKAGAVDFLPKPFRDQDMLDAVAAALGRDRARREALSASLALRAKYGSLTRREREVFRMVASGLLNKQIAGRLGVSEITVKLHRGNLMRKMQARTLATLIRAAEHLERAAIMESGPVSAAGA